MKNVKWLRISALAFCFCQAMPILADRLPSDQIDQALDDMGFNPNLSIQCELPTDDVMALDKPFGSRINYTADYGIKNLMVYEERFRFAQKTPVKAPCRGTVIRIEPSQGWVVILLPKALVGGQMRLFHTYVFDDVETDLELGDSIVKGQTIGHTQGTGHRFEWRYQSFPPAGDGSAESTKPWLVNQDFAQHPRLPLGAGCGVDCLST
ncbi:MAG: M23 family metallopeptidase, partial [Holophagales bacterium]|nr:M23 family metallopeptidase [Holophagales bacterium]